MVSSLPGMGQSSFRRLLKGQRKEAKKETAAEGRGPALETRRTDPTQVSIPRSSFTTSHTVVVLLIKTKDTTAYNTFP